MDHHKINSYRSQYAYVDYALKSGPSDEWRSIIISIVFSMKLKVQVILDETMADWPKFVFYEVLIVILEWCL